MKRLFLFCLSLVLICTTADAKKKKVKVVEPEPVEQTVVVEEPARFVPQNIQDSCAVALGMLQAAHIRQSIIEKQFIAFEHIPLFSVGVEESMRDYDDKEAIVRKGIDFVMQVMQPEKYLFNDTRFPIDRAVMTKAIRARLAGQEEYLAPEVIQHYNAIIKDTTLQQLPQTVVDSVNIVYANNNLEGAVRYFLGNDPTPEELSLFLEGFAKVDDAPQDSFAYFVGYLNGMRMYDILKNQSNPMKEVGMELEIDKFVWGMLYILNEDTAMNYTMQDLNEWVGRTLTAQKERYKESLTAEGRAFLEANARREEVHVKGSGLQYEILANPNPNGEHPTTQSTVVVHYRGTLLDGTEFDSSYSRGEPMTAKLRNLVSGWIEGVQLMTVGAKYRFYLPYNLGYGERGAGAIIPPYATLIFEIELLEIK